MDVSPWLEKMKNFSRIAQVGDVVKVKVYDGTVFEGRLSNIGHIIFNNNLYDYEFLISEIPPQVEGSFGAVLIKVSDIENISVIDNYSVFKDTNQGELLNVDKVKALVEKYGMSVSELAYRMNKDRPSISKILNRKRRDISFETAVLLAKALNVSVDEIINK